MASNNTLNRVQLIGRLGANPELRYTANGTPVVNFRVATNYSYTNGDGQEHTETEWTPIVAWRGLAEACNSYLGKGSRVYIEGRLRTRSWQDNGVTHYRTEVVAETVTFLDQRQVAAMPEESLPADLGQPAEPEPEAEPEAAPARKRRKA